MFIYFRMVEQNTTTASGSTVSAIIHLTTADPESIMKRFGGHSAALRLAII